MFFPLILLLLCHCQVDFSRGEVEATIRFETAELLLKGLEEVKEKGQKFGGNEVVTEILKGDVEKEFWVQSEQNKFKNKKKTSGGRGGGRGGRGGRGKIKKFKIILIITLLPEFWKNIY